MKNLYFFSRAVFLAAFFCLLISVSFGQTRKVPAKAAPKKPAVSAPTATAAAVTEIPAAEWGAITGALDKEDWTKSALLASLALGRLKNDNDKKQLAQLRYFYLYALAGQVIQGKMTYPELKKIVDNFIGKEFLMPNRQILADCQGNLNYICSMKSDENGLRVTATNKTGTAIHSFEYVHLAEKFDVAANSGSKAFLGGNLKQVEFNPNHSSVWIMRLVFDDGFINLTAN